MIVINCGKVYTTVVPVTFSGNMIMSYHHTLMYGGQCRSLAAAHSVKKPFFFYYKSRKNPHHWYKSHATVSEHAKMIKSSGKNITRLLPLALLLATIQTSTNSCIALYYGDTK